MKAPRVRINHIKIQEYMDQLNKNLVKGFYEIPVCHKDDSETWCIIRWLAIELEKSGICLDNHKKMMNDMEGERNDI